SNSTKDQTYNTPAVATLFLLADQVAWMLGIGGLGARGAPARASSSPLVEWAHRAPYTTPFGFDPAPPALVVGAVDFGGAVAAVAPALRRDGMVATEP